MCEVTFFIRKTPLGYFLMMKDDRGVIHVLYHLYSNDEVKLKWTTT